MKKLPMCRICLAENIRMYVVVNKNLHELYERLTDIPFVTDDSRPIHACSFCCAKLKQSFRLLRKCVEAEEKIAQIRFAQIMNGSYEPRPLLNQDHLVVAHGLICSPIESISIVEVDQTESIVVKEELPVNCDRQDDILEPKEDGQCDDLELENLDNSRLDEEDILAHGTEFDSDNDVPLMEFKIEKEEQQEASKEKGRTMDTKSVPAAKKPKLDVQKDKNEDLISPKSSYSGINSSEIKRNSLRHNRLCDKDSPFKCDICRISFSRKDNLETHIRTHTGEKPYKCDICQRNFSQKVHLKTHIRTHTGEKPYKCDICQTNFSQKVHLKTHICAHTGEKPFKCDICQSSFSGKGSLDCHIRAHTGQKPFKCDICQRSYSRKSALNRHIRTHTGEKPYKCDVCQRSCSQKCDLKKHIRTHTGEKPYKCDICLKSFIQTAHLKKHSRTHTGEKPHKCDVCQRSFSQKCDLKKHIRTHTGEKPYKCDICLKSFIQTAHLKKHIRTHTGEKPYICDRCPTSFSAKSSLKYHVFKQHK